jgi:hypothetical protein
MKLKFILILSIFLSIRSFTIFPMTLNSTKTKHSFTESEVTLTKTSLNRLRIPYRDVTITRYWGGSMESRIIYDHYNPGFPAFITFNKYDYSQYKLALLSVFLLSQTLRSGEFYLDFECRPTDAVVVHSLRIYPHKILHFRNHRYVGEKKFYKLDRIEITPRGNAVNPLHTHLYENPNTQFNLGMLDDLEAIIEAFSYDVVFYFGIRGAKKIECKNTMFSQGEYLYLNYIRSLFSDRNFQEELKQNSKSIFRKAGEGLWSKLNRENADGNPEKYDKKLK